MHSKMIALSTALLLGMGSTGQAQDMVQQGEAVFEKWCAICHDRGTKFPGTQALEMLYEGSVPAALADRTDLDGDMIRHFVHNGTSIMPFFRPTEISESDMTALIAYLTRKNQ